MPTPALYARYSTGFAGVWQRHRWKIVSAVALISFTPAVLERALPQVGHAPGRALFVFMFAWFIALAPTVAFRRPLPAQPWTKSFTVWAWARALVCSLWAVGCIWFVVTALAR